METSHWIRVFNYVPMDKEVIIQLLDMKKIQSIGTNTEIYRTANEYSGRKFVELDFNKFNQLNDIMILKSINQPYINKIYNISFDKDKKHIYYYVPIFKTLSDYLTETVDPPITKFINHIGSALAYLQVKNIIHATLNKK